jgi:hypothetical protein
MSERTIDAGRAIAHRIYVAITFRTGSDALDPMFEKPQNAQVVRIKIEAGSLDPTSMAPSPDGPLLQTETVTRSRERPLAGLSMA